MPSHSHSYEGGGRPGVRTGRRGSAIGRTAGRIQWRNGRPIRRTQRRIEKASGRSKNFSGCGRRELKHGEKTLKRALGLALGRPENKYQGSEKEQKIVGEKKRVNRKRAGGADWRWKRKNENCWDPCCFLSVWTRKKHSATAGWKL